jgi:hypothetical protein
MNNKKEHTRLSDKLKELKKIIVGLNNHSMDLIYISAKVEMKLRKENLTSEELAEYEEQINRSVREIQKKNNSILK